MGSECRLPLAAGQFIVETKKDPLQISNGPERCLNPIGNINFFENVIHVVLDRIRADI